jgi:hypothetical protein
MRLRKQPTNQKKEEEKEKEKKEIQTIMPCPAGYSLMRTWFGEVNFAVEKSLSFPILSEKVDR